MVLVLGTARAGTLYVSRVWKAVGLDVKHEAVGSAGCVSCFFAVNEPPPLDKNAIVEKAKHSDGSRFEQYRWDHVFHQVRHPLKVVASVEKIMSRADRVWMAPIIGLDPNMPKLEWAIRYTMLWNLKCAERRPELTYQVERMEEVWPELLKRCRLPYVTFPRHVNQRSHASSGVRKARTYTWDDLKTVNHMLTSDLRDFGRQLGYE